ncbi:hypothetical protein MRX96_034976 [Rhipicephalus microplus]
MGSSTLEYTGLITADPVARLLHIPPHWGSRLTILTNRIPGICRKGHTPRAALLQETCALIEEWYSDHLHVYTDGSGNKDGSVNSIILALRVERKCRLLLRASSTSAELTALNLVAHQLAEILPPSTVVFSDSRAMLLTLARGDRGSSIAQRLTCKFTVVVRSGGGCVVPVGATTRWSARKLGSRRGFKGRPRPIHTHHKLNFMRSFDVARQIFARHVRALHPDPPHSSQQFCRTPAVYRN